MANRLGAVVPYPTTGCLPNVPRPPRPPGPRPSARSARRTCCTRRRPPPRDRGCSCWPRLPEVVVEAAAFVDAAERQLERHVDLDPLGLAVRELAVEPAAALQVDHRVRGGRVRTLEEIVVGEGEELPAPRELHLLEPARVRALDAHAVLRELDGAALGALAAVERE